MTSADYRKYAEQCLDMAAAAARETRQKLPEMADVWLALASSALEAGEASE